VSGYDSNLCNVNNINERPAWEEALCVLLLGRDSHYWRESQTDRRTAYTICEGPKTNKLRMMLNQDTTECVHVLDFSMLVQTIDGKQVERLSTVEQDASTARLDSTTREFLKHIIFKRKKLPMGTSTLAGSRIFLVSLKLRQKYTPRTATTRMNSCSSRYQAIGDEIMLSEKSDA
jgi:hypothetical protein